MAQSFDRYGTFHLEQQMQMHAVNDGQQAEEKKNAVWQLQRERQWTARVRTLLAVALVCVIITVTIVSNGNERIDDLSAAVDHDPHTPIMSNYNRTSTLLRSTKGLELAEPSLADEGGTYTVYVYTNASGNVDVTFAAAIEEDATWRADAWATFNDSLHTIGWSQLWVQTADVSLSNVEDIAAIRERRKAIFYAAGYAEGALTHRRMDEHFRNVLLTFFPNGDRADLITLTYLQRLLQANLDWMTAQVKYYAANPQLPDATYWDAMGNLLAQFHGLVDGYRQFSQSELRATEIDLFMLNADGDLEDLITISQRAAAQAQGQKIKFNPITQSLYTFLKNLKCSALIRILPGFSDVVWGHATWDVYASMNRMFKHYDLPLPTTYNSRRKISMSSSPGYLSSVDDWYMTNAGLGVMETTHGVFDMTLYDQITPESVFCWLRSNIANLLATDGASWAKTFSKYNSGTYNDQWMIIDTHKFVQGKGFQPGGLTVLEQLPGFIHAEDASSVINTQGYWASYNVPYFPSIYAQSGFQAAYLSTNQSASWSHANCTRAKLFQRDAPQVETLDDLKRLMRYNDWQNDPLSNGHASHAIASRYDLETDPMLFSLDGAIDAKVTTLEKLQRLECEAVMGPTYDQNPVFEWTEELANKSAHYGHPKSFAFGYESMRHER